MIKADDLRKIYSRYGFEEKPSNANGVVVFTLHSGHFHNADIVALIENANAESVFNQYKNSGYACKIRNYTEAKEVENALFKGFFTVESTKSRLLREYTKFTSSIIAAYSSEAKYSFIKSRYYINGEEGSKDVIYEIISRMEQPKPILFLIEAAAGFGKTCTAFEIVKSLLEQYDSKIPLFTELARNRGAKIFRYVLLDEIDRSFPSLSSKLVRTEIQNGNVPVILDGFDELLHRSENNESYENAEPMLETIGELLSKNAKVILTTRRTAIFDGDDFHEWIDTHEDDFEIIRIRIDEPTVQDWLPPYRLQELIDNNFPIEKLSNPVLLSYLRFISDSEFDESIRNSDSIVEKYFTSMLERERVRQDIKILAGDQYEILKCIARDMISQNYTAESKDYVMKVIEKNFSGLLEDSGKLYVAEQRPTIDELLIKLAGHALLDRESDEKQGIGFVNEFVLGNFCADVILEDKTGEWLGDLRFIEPAILSFSPRSAEQKFNLWQSLKFSLEFSEPSEKIDSTIKLTSNLNIELKGINIENLTIKNIGLGDKNQIEDTVFINCTFCEATFNTKNIKSATFINCNFFNCNATEKNKNKNIHTLGCTSNNDFTETLNPTEIIKTINPAELIKEEIFILEKFWPVGRSSFTKHRPIKSICSNINKFQHDGILKAIENLKKKELLITPAKASFLELNILKISEVKEILGRA